MNKTEMAKKIAEEMSTSKKQALLFLKSFEKIVEKSIQNNDCITLQGFGTFQTWQQTERIGRNPKTGISVTIQARKSIKFKPGLNILNAINNK